MRVEIFEGEKSNQWYIRQIADNGEIVTISEGYVGLSNARRAAKKNYPADSQVYVIQGGTINRLNNDADDDGA